MPPHQDVNSRFNRFGWAQRSKRRRQMRQSRQSWSQAVTRSKKIRRQGWAGNVPPGRHPVRRVEQIRQVALINAVGMGVDGVDQKIFSQGAAADSNPFSCPVHRNLS